jgi:23S rRNA (pseudouridine1915-N3)-methyltransferase
VERLKIIWPGKTKNKDLRALQEFYLAKIRRLESCRLIEAKEAKGLKDRDAEKIKDREAVHLEKHLQDDYIVCLFDKGREMSSGELARFLEKRMCSSRGVAFVVGGFAGLSERVLKQANLLLSLSQMTFSHELCRVVLLEQIYRALTIQKGRQYAK